MSIIGDSTVSSGQRTSRRRGARRGRWSSGQTGVASKKTIVGGVPRGQCVAEVFMPTISLSLNAASMMQETWVRCRSVAIAGDVLCSTHRHQTKLAAAAAGIRTSGHVRIRVPKGVMNHPAVKFPLAWAKKIYEETPSAPEGAKFEIWDTDQLFQLAMEDRA